MKKLLSVLLVVVFVLAFSSVAFAQPEGYYHPASNGLSNSPAFGGVWHGSTKYHVHKVVGLTIIFTGPGLTGEWSPAPTVMID